MKISMYTLLPVWAGLLLSASCREPGINPEKEIEVITKPVAEEPSNWHAYKTMAEFTRAIKQLHDYSEEQLVAWEKEQKGFVSWRTLMESKADTAVAEIPDAAFATLISKDGRIQIADTIYQFVPARGRGIGFSIPERHKAEILSGNKEFKAMKGTVAASITLSMFPFPRWEDGPGEMVPDPNRTICDFPNGFLFPWWGQKGGQLFHADNGAELPGDNGRRVRIDYHRWRVGYLFYSSAGVRVKAWKDTRIGGWMSTVDMNRVNIESCIKGKIIVPGLFPVSFNESVRISSSNTNKLEKTLKWAAAPMHVEVLPEHFNLKFHVNYRGQQIARFIRE